MPCVAEFGIINTFEEDKDYSYYEPEKYNCILVDDGTIHSLQFTFCFAAAIF
jgi:hypothetical protein